MPRSHYLDFVTQLVSSMFKTVEREDLNPSERLVMKYGKNFRKDPNKGYWILYEAVKSKKMNEARFLLDKGAAVNPIKSKKLDVFGQQTLLQLALIHEDIELFKTILTRGSDVNDCGGEYRETALHTAVRLDQLEAVKLLLEHKCDINSFDSYCRTPLIASIEAGTDSLLMLELLFEYQPNLSVEATSGSLNDVTILGLDALLCAILLKRTDTIIYLLEHGADINFINSNHGTPLMFASMLGDEDTCRWLIERGCDINLPGRWGDIPLHIACAHNHYKIVKLLLTIGSNFKANTFDWTPLHATFYGERGSSYNEKYMSPEPVNHSNIFYALLDSGVDLNAHNEHYHASSWGDITGCQFGSVRYHPEITPLRAAVSRCLLYYGDSISLELLLEYGADVNMLDADQCSPLYLAAMDNNVDLFSFLICYGADVSQRCEVGTSLSVDCRVGEETFPRNNDMYMIAIKWKTLGLATISDEDMTSLRPHELTFCKTFEEQCKSELDNISKFNSELYKLLTKPINDIPHLAQHEIMNEIFCKTMEDRFPLYQSIMSFRLRRVRFRFSLLEQCKD